MSCNKVGTPARRDRMFLIAAIAHGLLTLLTLLGAAGESLGLDRMLKANTVKTRTLSLFRQGLIWYDRVPTMPADRLRLLSRRFGELMSAEMIYPSMFGGVRGDGSGEYCVAARASIPSASSGATLRWLAVCQRRSGHRR